MPFRVGEIRDPAAMVLELKQLGGRSVGLEDDVVQGLEIDREGLVPADALQRRQQREADLIQVAECRVGGGEVSLGCLVGHRDLARHSSPGASNGVRKMPS